MNEKVHADAVAVRAAADAAEKDDPVAAYDSDTAVAAVFPNEPLGRAARRVSRLLEKQPVVRDELITCRAHLFDRMHMGNDRVGLLNRLRYCHKGTPVLTRSYFLLLEPIVKA